MALFDKIKDFVKPFVESTSLDQPKPQTNTASVFKPAGKTTAVDSVSGAAPKASVFKPAAKTAQPTLSSMSIQNDRQKGIDWSSASPAQRAYNDTYYKTLDDPTHTKLFRDLQSFSYKTAGGADVDKTAAFRKSYKEGTTYLDNELKDYEQRYGKDSNEYKALQQFKGDYESLGRQVETKRARDNASTYSSQLDQNIQEIYGGLMAKPDFQEKVNEGLEKIQRNGNELRNFERMTENASELQKNLLLYIRATEGNKGVQQFMASGLGELMTATRAADIYSKTIENDSEAFRKTAIGAQRFFGNVGNAIPGTIELAKGITGSDKDDPDDKNLGGGYTISDSTDNYLQTTLAKDFEQAGVTAEQFKYIAELGGSGLKTEAGSSDWYKDFEKNASDYQKQVISFLYASSGEEAAKAMWEGIKDREQRVWDSVKKNSNRLATSVDEDLGALYQQYAHDVGHAAPGFLANVGGEGVTWEELLLQATGSAAEQVIPMLMGNLVGSAFRAAGATKKATNLASRIASATPMATMIGGRGYGEALDKGVSRGKAMGYGITEASLEFITGMLLDGAAGVGGKLTGDIRDKAVTKIASPVLRALADAGIRSWGEGTEEYVQEALEPIIASVFLGEGELVDALGETFDPRNILDPDRLYAGFLGALTALGMAPGNVAMDIHNNNYYKALGKGFNKINATVKAADVIINNPVEGPNSDSELYEDSKKTAEIIKNGGKVSDLAAGKMIVDYGSAGGDMSAITGLDTMTYNKDSIGYDDYVAGIRSVLVDMDEDVALAEDLARLATNQTITEEAQTRINESKAAQTILSQLQGDLDMSDNTSALTRAARATTFRGAMNKIYQTLKNENPDKTVVSPATQQLLNTGLDVNEAQKIGAVIDKVLNGEAITEAEAALVKASSPAIRATVLNTLDIELSEYADKQAVMQALNDFATEAAKVKEQQAAVRQGAQTAAQARGAAMQGGLTNGLRETNQGRPAEVSGDQIGTGLQGEVPGAVPEGNGIPGASGESASHLDRRGQRPGAGTERDGTVQVIPADKLDEGMKRLQRVLTTAGFDHVEFVIGGDSGCIYDPAVGGYVVRIRVDGQFGQQQYGNHETGHLWFYALSKEYREQVLNEVKSVFGDDFSKAFNFVKGLYDEKGYNDGLSPVDVVNRVLEDMICYSLGAQNFRGKFDFSAYTDAVRAFCDERHLEAISKGDTSDPAVREAIEKGRVNEAFYRRKGFNQTDNTAISVDFSIGEAPAQAEEDTAPASTTGSRADLDALKQARKNLANERRRRVKYAKTHDLQGDLLTAHREAIEDLNRQIAEYDSRIAELEERFSADNIEEENNGKEDRGREAGAQDQGRLPQNKEVSGTPARGRKTADQRESSRAAHEAQLNAIIDEGGEVVSEEDVPEEYKYLGEVFRAAAQDSDVSYVRSGEDDDEVFFLPIGKGVDAGFFINLDALETGGWRKVGHTLESLAAHELGHYYLFAAGLQGQDTWVYLRDALSNDLNTLEKLRDVIDQVYAHVYADKLPSKQREEAIVELLSGHRTFFDKYGPGVFDKVKPFVDRWFEENTDYSPDRENFSADDPEYYQSVGLIDPAGQTAAFTDNIGGVHEEIINQLNGNPGEDVKDFIARGGIRVKPGVGIEVNGDIAPTLEQYEMLDNIVENFTGKVFSIDFNINGVSAGTHTFEGADIDPNTVYTYLRNYYARRKVDIARNDMLKHYSDVLGMPVKTMEDAYKAAKFLSQMDDNPELQDIIDTYESQRYSADDILNPESEDYLGPEIDATTARNAQVDDVYRTQDVYFRNGEDAETSVDEDAIGEETTLDEDILSAQFDAIMAEIVMLNDDDPRVAELWNQYMALQESQKNKTKAVDEAEQEKPKKKKAKKTAGKETKKSPAAQAFKPKPETKKAEPAKQKEAAEPEPAPVSNPEPQAPMTYEQKLEELNRRKEELEAELAQNPEGSEDLLRRFVQWQTDMLDLQNEMNERIGETAARLEGSESAAAQPPTVEETRALATRNTFRPASEARTEERTTETAQPTPAPEAQPKAASTKLKDDSVEYAKKDKQGAWRRKLGKADTIEIRRLRSDRNTFDVRFTDSNGKVITYTDVAPASITKALAFKTGDRNTAIARTAQAISMAAEPSLEWQSFENPEPARVSTVVKEQITRSKDNQGRTVPEKLSKYLEKSNARNDKGELITVYRLAPGNGVQNAKRPGMVSLFSERAATMNTQRGLRGAEAYGQEGKAAGEKIRELIDELRKPNLSQKKLDSLRKQLADIEAKNVSYINGVTALDPWRPGFQFARPDTIVNGMSLLEGYLDVRKPKVIDAKGKGIDFVQNEVLKYVRDPANKAGRFDANKNPLGPHDGFKFLNVNILPEGETLGGGQQDLDTVWVTFRNNQAKSTYNTDPTNDELMQYSADDDFETGYTEGTLEDTIIKILRDKDIDRASAALAEYMANFMQTGVLPQMENERTQNIFQPRITDSQRDLLAEQLRKDIEKYGEIEAGENPAREIHFPKQTEQGRVRQTYRTIAESKNIPERMVPAIMREIVQGRGDDKTVVYQRMTDKAAIAYADRQMEKKGYDAVRAEWQAKHDQDTKLTKNDIAVGELVMIEAAKVGDVDTALTTAAELAEAATNAGQVVQAIRMIKSMPASYQLYYFQRVASRLNRQYSKRIKSGKMGEIKIDRDLAKAVINAKSQEALEEAIDALIADIAKQIPATMADKWNAWRYLAMLGNPKTHIRNLFGNGIFVPAKFAKDLIAAGLESVIIKDPNQRRTSLRGLVGAPSEYRALAEEDYKGIQKDLQAGGKYNPSDAVMDKRKIFDNKFLEWLRQKNGKLLEGEDGKFLRFHYVNALTNFLATRGMSVEALQSTPEGAKVMNAAREYAFSEALKATYRDASAIASALNMIKRSNPTAGILLDGLVPFTKTPINILKRGVEYSPIGLLGSLTKGLAQLKNGDIDANQFCDNMAAGLTGTGIAILGFWLTSLGVLKGSDDDDDKKADFDKLMGYQNYSINIGGQNFTIDWAAPSALPLFVGSALFTELAESNGLTFADIFNASTVIAEPLTQLSMLSGINDALKSAKWDENPLSSVVSSMATGYVSQGVPTFVAQIARTGAENRRTTYVDKNSDIPPAIQRWAQTNILGKIPGLNNKRAEYIDAWGRKDTEKNALVRLFDNMFAPWYRNEINITPVDKELMRLSEETGTSVLMSPADRYIEFDNQKHDLTAEQYETYAKVRGQRTFEMLGELFNSVAYQKGMTDSEKAKAVEFIKQYGNILGKQAVFPEYETDNDNWAEKCDGDTTRLLDMAMAKAQANALDITAGNNGEFYQMVMNSDWMSPVEQGYIIAQQYNTTSETVYVRKGGPKYELTKERKDQLYEYYRLIFPEYYLQLVGTTAWQNADNEKRLEMLSKVRSSVGGIAKAWLAERLQAAGAPVYTGK